MADGSDLDEPRLQVLIEQDVEAKELEARGAAVAVRVALRDDRVLDADHSLDRDVVDARLFVHTCACGIDIGPER